MARLVLQYKRARRPHYQAKSQPLRFRHQADRRWKIELQAQLPNATAFAWRKRNVDMEQPCFTTLRAAREYAEARLSIDSYPDPGLEREHLPDPRIHLRRLQPGLHRFALRKNGPNGPICLVGDLERGPDGIWRLWVEEDGHLREAGNYATLEQARSLATGRWLAGG